MVSLISLRSLVSLRTFSVITMCVNKREVTVLVLNTSYRFVYINGVLVLVKMFQKTT